MTRLHRKALVAAYRERKTIAGVFAVICNATGQAWVGTSRHIDTHRNGLWFALRSQPAAEHQQRLPNMPQRS